MLGVLRSLFVGRVAWTFLVGASLVLFLLGREGAGGAGGSFYHVLGAPVRGVHSVGVWVGEAFRTNTDLRAENAHLHEEVETLREWHNRARLLQERIGEYETLLKVAPEPAVGQITAQVIAEQRGPFVHALIVHAGAKQGVRQGQAAVGGHGLIGRVVAVAPATARVVLLTDFSSRIPVRVQSSHALLVGNNTRNPLLAHTHIPIAPGARVVTSGNGGLLPPGLPVGEVLSDNRVRLFAAPHAVSYVRLLDYPLARQLATSQ